MCTDVHADARSFIVRFDHIGRIDHDSAPQIADMQDLALRALNSGRLENLFRTRLVHRRRRGEQTGMRVGNLKQTGMRVGNLKNIEHCLNMAVLSKTSVQRVEYRIGAGLESFQQSLDVARYVDLLNVVSTLAQSRCTFRAAAERHFTLR
jgi:hypothetical protein